MGFQTAVKEDFTLKLAIAGIAGVGKSYTSFQLATLLSEGEPFAVIDTEGRKSRKYADEFKFDVSDLETSFSLGAYTKEIRAAETAGYKVLVIDGLSQMWNGKDGIKDMVAAIAKRDKIASFNAWGPGDALLADFLNKVILASPLHIICTMRSKTEYLSSTDNGKTQYKRIGLAPIQKDNLEFEFDLFAEMDHEHHLIFQKSLCTKLSGKVIPMAQDGEASRLVSVLKKWMGSPVRLVPSQPTSPAVAAQVEHRAEEKDLSAPVTEQQWASIRKLCQHLNKAEPEQSSITTFLVAKEMIAQLSQEYRDSKSKAS